MFADCRAKKLPPDRFLEVANDWGFFTQHYLKGLASADLASHDYVLTLQAVLAVGTIIGLIPAIVFAEHRRTLEELRKSEERTRLFFESRVAGMAITSPEKGWLHVNDRLCGMLGYTREELRHLTWADLTHPEDLAPNKAQFNRLLRGEINEYVREKRYVRKDGSILHANLSVACVRRRDGSVDYVLALLEDITERKGAEEELQLQSRLQELLMNTSAMYINLPLESVESANRISLGEIGDFVGADRASVYNYDFKRNVASLACEWCREGIKSHAADRQALPLAAFPEWDVKAHRRGESFYIPDVRSLPTGALKDLFTVAGNKSLLAVPITSHDGCVGFVGFAWTRSPHACSGKEQYLLKFFAHILVNVRQRKQVEEALRQSALRHQVILQTAMEGFWVTDLQGRLLEVNAAYCWMSGYSEQELLAMRICDLEADETPEEVAAHIRNIIEDGQARFESGHRLKYGGARFESRHRRKDGSLFDIETSAQYQPDTDRLVVFIRDITEHKRAEKRLQTSREQLRKLSARLQSLREEERTALAREIHDHLGQLLTALNLDLRLIEHRAAKVAEAGLRDSLCGKTSSARILADEIITSVQKIATELRPAILDRLGLEAAIEVEAQAFQSRTGVECQWTLPSPPLALAPNQATAIFRIFQEILTNVARHAQAANLAILLTQDNNALLLEVSDDGVGIQPADIANPASLGLLGMSERAAILGGKIAFGPKTPRGTTVAVQIPINGKAGQTP